MGDHSTHKALLRTSPLPRRIGRTDNPSFRVADIALWPALADTTHCMHERRTGRARMLGGGKLPGAAMGKSALISIVEDDQPFRESMRNLLAALGYTVETFSAAADFLQSPHLSATACLVSDVQMPGMTGVELHRHLIDAGYAIPTILVTAYPDEVVRRRALKDGVVCYLCKPVDDDHLERCLRSVLESATPHGENS